MPWADPHTWLVGEVPTADLLNEQIRDNLLWLREDYYHAEFTASVGVTATSEASPTTVVTLGTQTFDGAPVTVEFFCIWAQPGTGGLVLSLWDGGTNLGIFGEIATTGGGPVHLAHRLIPTAASHEYRVRGWNRSGTTGVVFAGPGGSGQYMPGGIRAVGG